MAGGYQLPRAGLDALVARFNNLQRQVDSLRSAAGILSAVIGKGGITVKDGGEIVAEGGAIRAIHEATGAAMAYFGKLLPPYKSGLMTATENGNAYFWAAVMEDGTRAFRFNGTSVRVDAATSFTNATSYHRIDSAGHIMLNAPQLQIYQLGNTGLAPNLAIEVNDGVPILKIALSSDRYKTDTAPVEVDVEEVLAYQAITWVHTSTMDDSPPGPIRRNIGHHAEGMDEFPSLRQFVNYDDEGRPDSVQEGRFEVALHEVMKALWQRVNDHEARLDALENN